MTLQCNHGDYRFVNQVNLHVESPVKVPIPETKYYSMATSLSTSLPYPDSSILLKGDSS